MQPSPPSTQWNLARFKPSLSLPASPLRGSEMKPANLMGWMAQARGDVAGYETASKLSF